MTNEELAAASTAVLLILKSKGLSPNEASVVLFGALERLYVPKEKKFSEFLVMISEQYKAQDL